MIVNKKYLEISTPGKIILSLFIFFIDYISYSALLGVIIYTIVMFVVTIGGTAVESPILTFLMGGFAGDLHISATGESFNINSNGKDITKYFSYALIIAPIIIELLLDFIKKVFHVRINNLYFYFVILIFWVIGTVVLIYKLNNFFVPIFLLVSFTLFYLVFYYLMRKFSNSLKSLV